MNAWFAATPQTLGASAESGSLAIEEGGARACWVVRWESPTGAPVAAEMRWPDPVVTPDPLPALPPVAPPPGCLAQVTHAGLHAAVRSGRRIPGQPPRFPSAALVFCLYGTNGWEDRGWAEEPCEAEIGAAALAGAPGAWLIAYRVRDAGGLWSCRAVVVPRAPRSEAAGSWRRLPDYPQAPGMAGAMVGVHGGVVMAAGGANFPGSPPWAGGTKAYYADIYALLPGEDQWRPAGRLPEARAYAAVVNTPQGMLLLGGEDPGRLFADSLLLSWNGTGVTVAPGPALPEPITSACAGLLDGAVYLAGGYQGMTPRLSRQQFWRLPWPGSAPGWELLEPWPGPSRALAVAAVLGGAFYLVSGLEISPGVDGPASPVYLRDAYRYGPGRGWERLPDLPWSAVAAPSPAPVMTAPDRLFLLGGVDGTQVGKIPRESALPNDILVYEPARGAWRLWPAPWPTPIVTVPAVPLAGGWAIVTGELKAGVRTTEAWIWHL